MKQSVFKKSVFTKEGSITSGNTSDPMILDLAWVLSSSYPTPSTDHGEAGLIYRTAAVHRVLCHEVRTQFITREHPCPPGARKSEGQGQVNGNPREGFQRGNHHRHKRRRSGLSSETGGGISKAFDGAPSCSWVREQEPPRKGEEKPTGHRERESLRKQGTVWFGKDKGAGKKEETELHAL